VLRGSSWNTCGRGTLLASRRNRAVPTLRNGGNGFRCVLGPALRKE
jgi:formylglycine-generating enzyme required for sulfatase activity